MTSFKNVLISAAVRIKHICHSFGFQNAPSVRYTRIRQTGAIKHQDMLNPPETVVVVYYNSNR